MAQDEDDDVLAIKCVLLAVMLISSGVFVALPIVVTQIRRVKESEATRRKFILSLFNCFAGGIFIATGFLHLLPEVSEEMDTAFDELLHEEPDYPFAYFVVCIGFLLVLIIEQVVLSCIRTEPKAVHETTDPSCHCDNIIRSGLPGATASGLFSQSSGMKPHAVRRTKSSPDLSQSNDHIKRLAPNSARSTDASGDHQEKINLLENNNGLKNYPGLDYSQDQVTQTMKIGILHAFAVAFALSVHSVFEGLAFGLQETMNDMLQVFVAIIIHKTVLAFSLGINFITAQVPWKTGLVLAVIFCLASPVGGGIGASLVASNSESVSVTLLNAILSGLATGTFFYVAFIEVISYELTNIDWRYVSQRLLLVLSVLIGFTLFAGLSFIHDHDHGHDDHDHDHDHDH